MKNKDRRVTIGIDVREAQGQRAGKGVYAYEITKALIELGATYEFVLYTREPLGKSFAYLEHPEIAPHVHVQVVRAPSLLWHVAVAFQMRYVDHVDLFFAPTSYIIPFLAPHKAIVVVHDVYALRSPEQHLKKAVRIERRTFRRAVSRARAVVAVSDFTKHEVMRLAEITENNMTVATNAVEFTADKIASGEELPAESMPLPHLPEKFILFVGTLEPRKNLIRLVEAFGIVKKMQAAQYAEIKLVIAGKKGWFYDEIFSTVKKLKLEQEVMFTGYVSDEQKITLYKKAQALVFPSLYEGFGIPPLEAMTLGTPVITSNVASLPEVVGDAALCIDPTNTEELAHAMETILTDTGLRNALINKGYERARHFSWRASAARILSLIETL